MLKIIADDKIPFLQGILEPYADVQYYPGAKTTAKIVKDADALITRTRTVCNSDLLTDSRVKMIATATIGYDHIDTTFCKANNINWTNAPGCNSGSVKQYMASALSNLALINKLNFSDLTIGIIGVGNVGSKVKALAEGLGMRVLLNDPPRQEQEKSSNFVAIDRIQKEADIITFHVPLTNTAPYKTKHLCNKEFLDQCKNGVVIINSSRGEVADNIDLLRSKLSGKVNSIILDVWENEPELNPDLIKETLVATPHIAGYSADGKANGTAMSVQAISEYFNLPLTHWFPNNLPVNKDTDIKIDCKRKSIQQIQIEAILYTYDIMEDDKRLRNAPSSFEKLRGSYPIRREFEAYKIILQGGSKNIEAALNKIGFKDVQCI